MVRALQVCALALLVLASPMSVRGAEPNAPALPRASVTVPELKTTGRTIHVAAGEDLQKALDQASAGDRIELEPRATYQGPFHLKAKDGDEWIVIAPSGALPKPGRHVTPADAQMMPKLI